MPRGTRAFDPTRPDNGKRWTPAELDELYNLRQAKLEVPWEVIHREHYPSRTLTAVVQAYKKISDRKSAEYKNTKRQRKSEASKAIAPKERELEQTPKELSTMTPPRYGILDPHRGDAPQDSEDSDKVGPEEVLYDIMPNGEYVSPKRKQSAVGSTGIRNEIGEDKLHPSKIVKLRNVNYPQMAKAPAGVAQSLEETTNTENLQPCNDPDFSAALTHITKLNEIISAAKANQRFEEETKAQTTAKWKELGDSNCLLKIQLDKRTKEYEMLLKQYSEMREKVGNFFQKDAAKEKIVMEYCAKILMTPGVADIPNLSDLIKNLLDFFNGRQDARKHILGIQDSVELVSPTASEIPNQQNMTV